MRGTEVEVKVLTEILIILCCAHLLSNVYGLKARGLGQGWTRPMGRAQGGPRATDAQNFNMRVSLKCLLRAMICPSAISHDVTVPLEKKH